MNWKNTGVLAVMVAILASAFVRGGYTDLHPFIFTAGLCLAVIIALYTVLSMDTPALIVFLVIATLVAAVDEYAHTAAGTLAYFDRGVPAPLTVAGWGIFLLVMLAIARLVLKIPPFSGGKSTSPEAEGMRIVPVLFPMVLIALSMTLPDNGPPLTPLLLLVYLLLAVFSLYYALRIPLRRNVAVLIAGLGTGLLMEYLGALEGIWTFQNGEPVSLLILFSWPLRFWTVLCLCSLAGYDICGRNAGRAHDGIIGA